MLSTRARWGVPHPQVIQAGNGCIPLAIMMGATPISVLKRCRNHDDMGAYPFVMRRSLEKNRNTAKRGGLWQATEPPNSAEPVRAWRQCSSALMRLSKDPGTGSGSVVPAGAIVAQGAENGGSGVSRSPYYQSSKTTFSNPTQKKRCISVPCNA